MNAVMKNLPCSATMVEEVDAMHRNILILDDEVWISAAISEILEEHDMCVVGPFRSNALALAFLMDHRPDAAILDFNVADGTSRATAARLLDLHIPFLVASGYPKLIARDAEFQSAVWLDKPFGETKLMQRVADLFVPSAPTSSQISIHPI
jgi:two-component SAPR family response regulator